jgi:hypothetical protein
MKKILQYSGALLISGVLFSACNKNLELAPPYQLTTANAFTNLESFNQQLSGVYGGGTTTSAGFASPNYYNGFLGPTADIFTDNLYETIESLVNYQAESNWDYLSNSFYMQETWRQPYNVIFQANSIINNIDKFKDENVKKYNRILGQALTARAIAHFDVLKSRANNLDRNSSDLGVPVVKTTEIALPARNTVKEVYDAIYADLTQAITLLSDVDININSSTSRAFLDVWGARAAFARVSLYAKDYATAITSSTAVINQFPLANRTNYPGVWNDSRIDEVIWAIQNNSGDPGTPFPSSEVMSFRFNRNTYGIHPSLISLYDQVNDVRFSTFYFVRNTTGGSTNYALQKFRGKGAASDNLVNFKVFRTSEMYLIRAEANAQTGKPVEANLDLSTLKTARIAGYVHVPLAGQALLDEIQNERRRELAAEGHRWFDLKRTTRVINRPVTGIGNRNAQVKTSLTSTSPKWVWPIPEVEVRANPNIVQNPGYQ